MREFDGQRVGIAGFEHPGFSVDELLLGFILRIPNCVGFLVAHQREPDRATIFGDTECDGCSIVLFMHSDRLTFDTAVKSVVRRKDTI